MQQIPLLGNLFKVVTVREYQVDEERNSANVKVPQVEVAATDENADSDTVEQAKVSADTINFDINEETSKLIEEFKKSMENEEGYQNIYIYSLVQGEFYTAHRSGSDIVFVEADYNVSVFIDVEILVFCDLVKIPLFYLWIIQPVLYSFIGWMIQR